MILTKDEDFSNRVTTPAISPVIVWLRLGNASSRQLLSWLEPRWPGVVQLLARGHPFVEVVEEAAGTPE